MSGKGNGFYYFCLKVPLFSSARDSLYYPGWPWRWHPLASGPWVLGLHVDTTAPSMDNWLTLQLKNNEERTSIDLATKFLSLHTWRASSKILMKKQQCKTLSTNRLLCLATEEWRQNHSPLAHQVHMWAPVWQVGAWGGGSEIRSLGGTGRCCVSDWSTGILF